jgi:hypothetical protein
MVRKIGNRRDIAVMLRVITLFHEDEREQQPGKPQGKGNGQIFHCGRTMDDSDAFIVENFAKGKRIGQSGFVTIALQRPG